LHVSVHFSPSHPTVPPDTAGQTVQLVPQLMVELWSLQIGAATVPPQLRYPVSHWMLHVPLVEQTGCECEPAGCAWQGVQASPHDVALCVTHTSLHLC